MTIAEIKSKGEEISGPPLMEKRGERREERGRWGGNPRKGKEEATLKNKLSLDNNGKDQHIYLYTFSYLYLSILNIPKQNQKSILSTSVKL